MTLPQLGRYLGWCAAAMVVLVLGNRAADWLAFRNDASDAARWAAVAVAVASWVPLLSAIGWVIGRGDEFQQRMFLEGIAFAFAGGILLDIGFQMMRMTGLVGPTTELPNLLSAFVLWILGMATARAVAAWRYRE